jgi:DNA-binding MarR family transcriptional regulator
VQKQKPNTIINTFHKESQSPETEYIILENIYDSAKQQSSLRQRDLAQIAGASLGMTNSILKRLAQKGWITIKRINSRNIQYGITLEGINEIFRHSYRYFKRTIKNVVYYKDILEDVILRAKKCNISKVVLVGSSDLDFIVEHACRRNGLSLSRTLIDVKAGKTPPPGTLKIYSENITDESLLKQHNPDYKESPETGAGKISYAANIYYLSRLIIKPIAKNRHHPPITNEP